MFSGSGPFDPVVRNNGTTSVSSFFDDPGIQYMAPVEEEQGRYMTRASSWFDMGGVTNRPVFANGGGYNGDALLADFFAEIRRLGRTLTSARNELMAAIESEPTTQNFNRLRDLEQNLQSAFTSLEAEVARAGQSGLDDNRLASVRRLADIIWGGAGLGQRTTAEISPVLLIVENEIRRLGKELRPVLAQLYKADAVLNQLGDISSPRAIRILGFRENLLGDKQAIMRTINSIAANAAVSLSAEHAGQIAALVADVLKKADAEARAVAGVGNSGPSSSGAAAPSSGTPPAAPSSSGSGFASMTSWITVLPEFIGSVVSSLPIYIAQGIAWYWQYDVSITAIEDWEIEGAVSTTVSAWDDTSITGMEQEAPFDESQGNDIEAWDQTFSGAGWVFESNVIPAL